MKLVVGLGNPTDKYAGTRHNIGFMALDYYLKDKGLNPSEKFKGLIYKGPDVMYLKPQTFMNLSGESVGEAMRYFSIDAKDVLVIYDDIDLPPGACRIRESGGTGGHNGMKSIIAVTQTEAIARIRIGIGKGKNPKAYVLKAIPKKERPLYDAAFENVKHALDAFLSGHSIEYLMNHFQMSDSPLLG